MDTLILTPDYDDFLHQFSDNGKSLGSAASMDTGRVGEDIITNNERLTQRRVKNNERQKRSRDLRKHNEETKSRKKTRSDDGAHSGEKSLSKSLRKMSSTVNRIASRMDAPPTTDYTLIGLQIEAARGLISGKNKKDAKLGAKHLKSLLLMRSSQPQVQPIQDLVSSSESESSDEDEEIKESDASQAPDEDSDDSEDD